MKKFRFMGSHSYKIDAQGAVTLPPEYRDLLSTLSPENGFKMICVNGFASATITSDAQQIQHEVEEYQKFGTPCIINPLPFSKGKLKLPSDCFNNSANVIISGMGNRFIVESLEIAQQREQKIDDWLRPYYEENPHFDPLSLLHQ